MKTTTETCTVHEVTADTGKPIGCVIEMQQGRYDVYLYREVFVETGDAESGPKLDVDFEQHWCAAGFGACDPVREVLRAVEEQAEVDGDAHHSSRWHETLDAMETWGGGFVKALAAAWRRADMENNARMMATYGTYYKEYRKMAEDYAARKAVQR